MTRFYEGRTRPKAGRSSKAQWLPPTAGLRDWRTQLPTDDVERIEAAAGGLIASLGYGNRFDRCAPAVRARVAEVRETFTRQVRADGRVVPRNW
jgi:hypothetical protein